MSGDDTTVSSWRTTLPSPGIMLTQTLLQLLLQLLQLLWRTIHMEGDHATLTLGNNVTFSGNYASSDSYSISTSSGGAIYMQGVNSFLTIRNGAIFTNNYSSTYGGAHLPARDHYRQFQPLSGIHA